MLYRRMKEGREDGWHVVRKGGEEGHLKEKKRDLKSPLNKTNRYTGKVFVPLPLRYTGRLREILDR